jgi:hypothetical protein
MAQPTVPPSPRIAAIVRRLRHQIRCYIWLEGLAAVLAWAGIAFWLGLALDYLPVLGGANEMPRPARSVMLIGFSLVLVYLFHHYVIRRAFVRLADRSLALLLERQFPDFNDTLVTAVDTPSTSTEGPQPELHEAMLRHAIELANERSERVDTAAALRYRPLVVKVLAATLAVASVGLFGWFAHDAFVIWTSRMLLLSDAPWPRRAHIEVLDFPDGRRKVAEGADLTLRVRAVADRPTPPPSMCTIDFRLPDGEGGRVNMSRDGEPRDGYQFYRYQGPPFQGMLDHVDFDVIGYDHRIGDLRVDVVTRPSIVGVRLDCQPPKYMNQPPRQLEWRPGTSLPVGSQVTITAQVTKPLERVMAETIETGRRESLDLATTGDRLTFRYQLPHLEASTSVDFELLDLDGATSQNPYRLSINAIEDLTPQVELDLHGIGTAITPQVRLPVAGQIRDDYRVREAWFQLDRPSDGATHRVSLDLPPGGNVNTPLDLRRQRNEGQLPWPIEPGDKVVLSVQATDYFDLGDTPHVGQSDQFALDVVTPPELLALLEARELNLKRRFEQTITELMDTRDSLLRLQANLVEAEATSRAPDEPDEGETSSGEPREDERIGRDADEPADGNGDQPNDDNSRDSSLRRLRVQRARQEGTKSQQEVQGVAASFADIRDELVNNRVDTPERRDRLQEQIIRPLEVIVADDFTRWLDRLTLLESQISGGGVQAIEQTIQVVEQTNELIATLQGVLENMLELETYNELLDLVRSILGQQDNLLERTQAERKRQDRAVLEE